MLKEFLKVVFIPELYIYDAVKKNGGSTLKGVILLFVAFFSTMTLWVAILGVDPDIEEKAKSQEIVINELKAEIKVLREVKEEKKEIKKEEVKEVKKEAKKEYTFTSGNYTSDNEFEPGIYDIIAISGRSGNVISSNMFNGGINAIMGLNSEFAEKEYKNIELPKGTKLEIKGGIKIKLRRVIDGV